jgi:hypothetical protein
LAIFGKAGASFYFAAWPFEDRSVARNSGRHRSFVPEGMMLRKRKDSEAKKSVAEVLLRDMQGTAAEKLALFEKVKARGGVTGEDRAELLRIERTLRTFAAE